MMLLNTLPDAGPMRICAGLIIAVCVTITAAAQVQRAIMEGTVVDSTGLPVPGASVDVRDPATNQTRSAMTDGSGAFRVTSLPPGVYDVRVELSGFAPYEQRNLALPSAKLRTSM
jgi:hypothetical protein